MKIEHLAFNVAEPVAMASWYQHHFGLRIVRHLPEPNQTHFLADDAGTVLEIYCNPPDQVPDYAAMDPLQFHLAFTSEAPEEDAARLVAAGAQRVSEVRPDLGSLILMLRDPWGVPFQLCRRSRPLQQS
ncbi:catechol 2,3-dioxygenase-like lactoylglutathione lyase family enzyme [Haloferula luteola]|uniref:Catechol 2,3-dioxygenase-like lactoylglutathione lyase family enzyme n=1 Tax=Haloferula luteola TaxID=595692 RepID=A0A840V458_9BACT|nr:catechol 2,3-dioxygenase-like lactoylglutathione lyase family enzyme [Haloferula luteola]